MHLDLQGRGHPGEVAENKGAGLQKDVLLAAVGVCIEVILEFIILSYITIRPHDII